MGARADNSRSTLERLRCIAAGGQTLASAWIHAFTVEALLVGSGLQGALRWIDAHDFPSGRLQSKAAPRRIAKLVRWAYRMSPFSPTCLRTSLVEYFLGRRAGLDCRFVIGVRRAGGLEAHAWVEWPTFEGAGQSVPEFEIILTSPGTRSTR